VPPPEPSGALSVPSSSNAAVRGRPGFRKLAPEATEGRYERAWAVVIDARKTEVVGEVLL
jgi:hypothetical protein